MAEQCLAGDRDRFVDAGASRRQQLGPRLGGRVLGDAQIGGQPPQLREVGEHAGLGVGGLVRQVELDRGAGVLGGRAQLQPERECTRRDGAGEQHLPGAAATAPRERLRELVERRKAIGRLRRGAPHDDALQPRRHATLEPGGPRGGATALQDLVERRTQAVLIGAGIDGATFDLLRGHVRRGPGGRLGLRPSGGRARDAEVDHAGPTVVADDDVVGLHVAVADAGGVGGRQAVCGGQEHVDDLRPCAPPVRAGLHPRA